MNSKVVFHTLHMVVIGLLITLGIMLYIRTEQLQEQVDDLQKQVTVYRQLVFNLYGKDVG